MDPMNTCVTIFACVFLKALLQGYNFAEEYRDGLSTREYIYIRRRLYNIMKYCTQRSIMSIKCTGMAPSKSSR